LKTKYKNNRKEIFNVLNDIYEWLICIQNEIENIEVIRVLE
jgi:hypothetical protein